MNPINIALVIEQIKQFNVKIQSRRILVIFTSSWRGFYPMKSCFTVSIISYLPRVTYYMCLDYHTILWFLYYIYWLYCIFYSCLRLKFSHGRTHVLSTKTSYSLPKIAEKKRFLGPLIVDLNGTAPIDLQRGFLGPLRWLSR